MKKALSCLLPFLLTALLLLGCAPALKNPYKGQEPKFVVTKAEFLNSAQAPSGTLGDKEHFVLRVDLNAYNVAVSDTGEKDEKDEVMKLLSCDLVCLEAKDYVGKCAASDSSALKYSKKNAVIEGAVLYYLVPAIYRDEAIRFVVYNTYANDPNRKVLFETSNFNKSKFNVAMYENSDTQEPVNTSVLSSGDEPAKPDGIEYSGAVPFPQAENVTFSLTLSSDKSKVLFVEMNIENLELEQQSGNTLRTYKIGRITTTSAKEYAVQDGKVFIDGGDFKLDLAVLDACVYGTASYIYRPTDAAEPPIDLGSADAVLQNITNPAPLPDDLTELMQKFKEGN